MFQSLFCSGSRAGKDDLARERRRRQAESQADSGASSPRSAGRSVSENDLHDTIHSGSVRRDCTAQFLRMREMHVSQRQFSPQHVSPCAESSSSCDRDEHGAASILKQIHEQASTALSSLASKLAQYDGLRQFGVQFAKERAPPLELRLLVPELEAGIVELLQGLGSLTARLQELEVPACSRNRQLRTELESYVARALKQGWTAFEAQRLGLSQLASNEPLHSPRFCPQLEKRLAAAMRPCASPSLTVSTAPSSNLASSASSRLHTSHNSSSASPCPSNVVGNFDGMSLSLPEPLPLVPPEYDKFAEADGDSSSTSLDFELVIEKLSALPQAAAAALP